MKLKELWYLLLYSFKSFFSEMMSYIYELKKPRTWSTIFLVIFILGLYQQNITLIKWSLPFIALIYIIRQKVDGSYRKDKFTKDIALNKDTEIVKEYYNSYVQKTIRRNEELNINKSIMSYNDWKEKNKTEKMV